MSEVSTENISVYQQKNSIPKEFVSLNDDIRFIKVKNKSKIPLEPDWPWEKNYSANDPSLLKWIKSGGNWGYFLRDDTDLCILDADNPEELSTVITFIGRTLTIKTGREDGGYHILFRCTDLGKQKIFLYSPDKKDKNGSLPLNIGDIRPGGTKQKYQCVGPGSIHPNSGKPYTIIDSTLPVTVQKDEFLKKITVYTTRNQSKKSSRRKVKTGEIDNYLTQQAGILFNRGYRDIELFTELSRINQEDCDPPSEDHNLHRICSSAMRNFKPLPPQKKELPQKTFALTDIGNAERFENFYGEMVLFCPTLKKWFIWNGKYWNPDEINEQERLAINVVRRIYREAEIENDDKKRIKISSWAQTSESQQKRTAMLQTVSSLLAIHHKKLDDKPDLFNLQNGTYNLTTHEFREHKQDDKLTKISKCEYHPGAPCPIWESHLNLIFSCDQDLIDGFQELCGYSLLSGNPEEIFIIAWGTGRNGKGKTIDALTHVFGDYAGNTPFGTFIGSKYSDNRGAASPELVDMIGTRLIRASESDSGARLSESLIKTLTGGDLISARGLYQKFVTFKPEFIIFLQTNHKPVLRNWDPATEARIWLIPFDTYIEPEKRDYNILEKLTAEAPGIFNWMIEGLKRYQSRGYLQQPERVKSAIAEYKFEQDRIGEFIQSRCIKEPKAWIFKRDLYVAYENDCRNNGQEPENPKLFTILLQQNHGIKDGQRKENGRTWIGIRLKRVDELDNIQDNDDDNEMSSHESLQKTIEATYNQESSTNKEIDDNRNCSTLHEWIALHKTPANIPAPDQYCDFVTSGRCVCIGCNERPIKTASGNYPLCQKHLREYTVLYEQEHKKD